MIAEELQVYVLAVELLRCAYQPRQDFDFDSLQELSSSIKTNGIIQPIVVRPIPDGFYEIIAGERRWRAAQMAGLTAVPCLIRHYDNERAAAVTLIENIQRCDLNPIEEAQSIQRLIDEFDYAHEEVAVILGKSRAQITNTVRLLRLEEPVRKYLINRSLSEGHGKILAGLPRHEQLYWAEQCAEKSSQVRQLELALKKEKELTVATPKLPHYLITLENTLKDQLGTEVKIEKSSKASGWLKIYFYDNDILNGLLEKMGVELEN